MSASIEEIQSLDSNQLAQALEYNGYADCSVAILTKTIDGDQFLKLTELQISLWRLPPTQARRLWSFIQLVRSNPSQFLLPAPNQATIKKSEKPTINKNFNSPKEMIKPHGTTINLNSKQSQETNSSTLTKQESSSLKNKLELMFRREDEGPNTSFVHSQKQPRLPPKPAHLKIPPINTNLSREESSDENEDGYLSPIKVEHNQSFNKSFDELTSIKGTDVDLPNSSTFLSKFKKSNESLERKSSLKESKQVNSNRTNIVSVRDRPLPPLPTRNNNLLLRMPNNIQSDEMEDEIDEYTPVLEDDMFDNFSQLNSLHRINRTVSSNRFPLVLESKSSIHPPIPNLIDNNDDNEEVLPEYTSVVESDEEQAISASSTDNHFKNKPKTRPLPPLPSSIISQKVENKINKTPIVDDEMTEYTSIVEEDADDGTNVALLRSLKIKDEKLKSPLPVPIQNSAIAKLPIKKPKPRIHQLLKERAELPSLPNRGPKPFLDLPKPPSQLPLPSSLIMKEDDDLSLFEMDNVVSSIIQSRPLPPPPPESTVKIEEKKDEPKQDEEVDLNLKKFALVEDPYYRDTDRKGARMLLEGLDEGAFLIRPSRRDEYVCIFSIMHRKKMFNLGIEMDMDGALWFSNVAPDFEQPLFYSTEDIVNYYSIQPLYVSGETIFLKIILPSNKR